MAAGTIGEPGPVAAPIARDATARATLDMINLAVFVASCPVGLALFFLPLYSQALGASATRIGALFAVFALVPILARPLVGHAVDHFGRRPFMLAGLALFVVAWALYAASARVAILFVARVVEGVAGTLLLIAAYAALADLVPPTARGAAIGRFQSMINLGAFLGGGIGFPLLFAAERLDFGIVAGWRVAFGLYAVATLVALVIAGRRLRETPRPTRIESLPSQPRAPTSAQAEVRPARPRALLPLLLISLGTATANGVTQPILILYLRDHVTANLALLLVAFMPAAIVYGIAPAPLGRLSDRIGRRRVMASGLAAAGVIAGIFPSLPNIALLGALWTLEALCVSAAVPAEGALVADLTGGDRRGRAYGLYSLAVGLGATVGPLIGGWCYEHASSAAPFYVNALLLPISALLVILLPIEARHEARGAVKRGS